MEIVIVVLLVVLLIGVLYLINENKKNQSHSLGEDIANVVRKEFKENRGELAQALKENREEMTNTLLKMTKNLEDRLGAINEGLTKSARENREELAKSLKSFGEQFTENVKSFNELQRQKFDQLNVRQEEMVKSTEEKLEKMRETVDEKLQKTLNERLSKSFEQVGKQLESVQKGLGEMQTLAQDVGGLKKVLSNVKMRGGVGETQLAMLLENILAPTQYEANVKTKSSSNDIVEFAIKLPGNDTEGTHVWLPVDAKFPKDIYEKLQDAHDIGDIPGIELAQKELESTIKKMAKDIRDKYLDPPNTTEFAIMFLPFEGIYAEVVRKAHLLEELQRDYRVIVTGPTTFAAILNSLQMGFKTLTIQKYSGQIQQILGAVKTEFGKFGGMLEKAKKNFQTGMNQLDDVVGTRTRAINRKLQDIESIEESASKNILGDLGGIDASNEDAEG